MGFQDCIDEIQRAAGRQLDDDELDDLLTELQMRMRRRKAEDTIADMDAAMREAAEEYAQEMATAALIQKRNAAINLRIKLESIDFVRTQFAGDPALGIESLLVGVNRPGLGTRMSAAAEQAQLKNYYLGGLMSEIERAGHWDLVTRGTLDREISQAMWARDTGASFTGPREAREIGDIIAKWQEIARQDLNQAGAWVGKMPGYIVRQSHDMFKIRAAGFEGWRDAILPRLDHERTFGDADPQDFLQNVYRNLASGVHLKASQPGDAPSGFSGGRNIAKRPSAERKLHFASADDWFDYNQSFGTGSLREALLRGFEMNAQNTGLMRRLGTNPETTLREVTDHFARRLTDPIAKQKFAEFERGKMRQFLAAIDGTSRNPVNAMGARISSEVRVIQNMAKLGGAVMSQITDIGFFASEMRYQGRTVLSGLGEALQGLRRGRNRKQMAEIDGMIGVVMDGMIGDVTARFSIADDNVPGRLAKLQQMFFKYNGMAWWNDSVRAQASRAMAHRLAIYSDTSFSALDPDLRRVIGLYGFDEGRWDIVRSGAKREADGRNYVVPESVMELPDAPFAAYLEGQGRNASKTSIKRLRREIADSLRAYYVDRAEYAVPIPDARVRATMQRGTRPGTVEGEILRFIGQFKSFPVAVIQKVMGREIYGRGSNSIAEALRNGNGEMAGMASMIATTTLLGYVAMSAKDLAKGRTPRDPLAPRTWAAAAVQGGGAGIYGDFLFGEIRTRFGGGPIATALGPTAGAIEDLFDIAGRIRAGDDAAAKTFQTIVSNTPFANLFYTRIVLDYLILWQIQEWLNPGAMKRMEQRIEKENAQQFLIRPSERVN